MKIIVKLPAKPVDLFEIRAFQVGHYNGIVERRWVYYVDISYAIYCKDPKRHGAPIVDQWMSSERTVISAHTTDGKFSTTGRYDGWKTIAGFLATDDADGGPWFETIEQAIRFYKGCLASQVLARRRDMSHAYAMLEQAGQAVERLAGCLDKSAQSRK